MRLSEALRSKPAGVIDKDYVEALDDRNDSAKTFGFKTVKCCLTCAKLEESMNSPEKCGFCKDEKNEDKIIDYLTVTLKDRYVQPHTIIVPYYGLCPRWKK